ncbi:MAG: hypothetical protein A2126_01750 [Candidatus Woykebacteria bacterium GWB1_45_5]|uniref:Methyltransferase type 11 domain-containing protein n=1 Tax=Candidatus Woykebacteria bacterium GWB1_45_5 TaxID=1802592 RepID=A0A1G1W5R1_9BACT|nr:MAG: hypothetical protein A2126_01750 [Candidatus Woykebacteria bacterium GWB1_45_5]
MSNRLVSKNLVQGSWLDLLCGYNSPLQAREISNPKISRFVSLDLKLNPYLKETRIELLESVIEKKLDFAPESFDNITIINGLEHLWSPQEILDECFRVLRKNGTLQVIVPTWLGKPILEWLAFKRKDPLAHQEMDDHKMYYDEKTLWPMLVKAGFRPRNIMLKRIKFYFSLYAKATKI